MNGCAQKVKWGDYYPIDGTPFPFTFHSCFYFLPSLGNPPPLGCVFPVAEENRWHGRISSAPPDLQNHKNVGENRDFPPLTLDLEGSQPAKSGGAGKYRDLCLQEGKLAIDFDFPLFFDQNTFFWTCRRVNDTIRRKFGEKLAFGRFSYRLLADATCMLPYRAPPNITGYMGGRFYVGGTVG